MKSLFRRIAGAALMIYLLAGTAFAKELIPVGQIVGLELQDRQVVVVGFDEEQGQAAKAAGLLSGDIIKKIDSVAITCAEDVRKALQSSNGTVAVEITREGKEKQLQMTPYITKDGPRLGVYLRQGITGIGTVTWYDPETHRFGTLGHGVNDSNGQLLPMTQGWAYRAKVMTVKKGKVGEPGQLYGSILSPEPAGMLSANTRQGVFGTCRDGWEGQAIEVASMAEIKTGDAVIRTTVSGDAVREYSVKILKIYPKGKGTGRNMLIRITDPDLLATTGGIVQGMSGSPIIQNGKLIGAVTHVLVNDPTTGYGIFIENMLDAAA